MSDVHILCSLQGPSGASGPQTPEVQMSPWGWRKDHQGGAYEVSFDISRPSGSVFIEKNLLEFDLFLNFFIESSYDTDNSLEMCLKMKPPQEMTDWESDLTYLSHIFTPASRAAFAL